MCSKSTLLTLSILFGFTFSAFTQCPLDLGESSLPPEDDMLLYFPFDGIADNLGDPVYSASVEGATYVASGCGEGLEFDGNDDYVLVTPSLYLTEDYTVTAWINAVDFEEAMGIFSIRDQCVTTYRGYSISQFNIGDYGIETLNNQVNKHIDCTGWSSGDRYTNAAIEIPAGEDVFVALTVENNISEDRVVKLYMNCEEFETVMTIDFPTDPSFDPLLDYVTTIGASSSIAGEESSFNGVVDEVRLYERVLTDLELLDVYHHCRVLEMEVDHYTDCGTDSAVVVLNNAQLNVEYQLYDITNDELIGPVLSGSCDTLFFFTDMVTALTEYEIVATSTLSGCAINLDSVITLSPEVEATITEDTLYMCEGDSLLINDTYVFTEGVYSDTFEIEPTCDSVVLKSVFIYEPPIANLSYTVIEECYPIDVSFLDESVSDSAIIGWNWGFGDGETSSDADPLHEYSEPGTYVVNLEVETINGCFDDLDTIIELEPFEIEASLEEVLCPGASILLYGDWVSEAGVYKDTVNFTPFCDSIISTTVTMAPSEEIEFSVSDSVGCYPLPVSFENESALLVDVVSWDWDFGDGGTSGVENPTHEYDSPGPYEVTFSITTSDGCIFDTSMTLFYPNVLYFNEVANIALCEGESVLIDGEWIDTPGTYLDTNSISVNCDSVIRYIVTIADGLNVDFSFENNELCLPVEVNFTDETTILTGGESWYWQFGDGSISTEQNPSHIYESNGDFEVVLQVTSADDCVYDYSETVEISAAVIPLANFTISPTEPTIEETVLFNDLSINAQTWFWDFGGGQTSTDQHPSHVYNDRGSQNVMLIVTNGSCSDTAYYSVFVKEELLYYIPNTFTPDGDNFNDSFLPVFTSGFDPYDYHMTIYNRWGEIIFESYNTAKGWDGTYGGSLAEDGVYIWTIEFGDINNDERNSVHGHVTLLK